MSNTAVTVTGTFGAVLQQLASICLIVVGDHPAYYYKAIRHQWYPRRRPYLAVYPGLDPDTSQSTAMLHLNGGLVANGQG